MCTCINVQLLQNAAVCLRLRPGNRREMRELTIMYLCWCDQRRKLLAYIANLKTHLVRQIQVSVHEWQYKCNVHVHVYTLYTYKYRCIYIQCTSTMHAPGTCTCTCTCMYMCLTQKLWLSCVFLLIINTC